MDIREQNELRAKRLRESNPFLPIHEVVYRMMLADIIACHLEPGEKLVEEQCAELYGCSRSTIRKVFDRLVTEEWLERSESHRIRVRGISRENHMETMDYRMAIEAAATRLAAKNRTREDLQLIEHYTMQCDTTDVYQLHVNDLEFHRAIFAACKNRYLLSAYHLIDLQISRAKLYTAPDFEDVCKDCFQEHLLIYQAIKNRDEAAAYKAAKQHIKMMLDTRLLQED